MPHQSLRLPSGRPRLLGDLDPTSALSFSARPRPPTLDRDIPIAASLELAIWKQFLAGRLCRFQKNGNLDCFLGTVVLIRTCTPHRISGLQLAGYVLFLSQP